MRHTKGYLERCEVLWRLGVAFALEGQVARGFADLGYEEFIVLPNGKKLISLLSGSVSEITDDGLKNLFVVPAPDQSIGRLLEIGASSLKISNFEERFWELTFSLKGKIVAVREATLEGVLVEGLIESLKV